MECNPKKFVLTNENSNSKPIGRPMEKIDETLVKKAQTGDIKAFEEIFKKTNKRIYNFLLHLSSDSELAADLTQETFIRAFKSLKSLKSNKALVSWLHRIALNLCRDEMKKPRIHAESIDQDSFVDDESDDDVMEIEDWTNNPDKITADKELQSVVRDAISSLPEIHRTVVIMHHIEGIEIDEIARILKIKSGTVMSRLARAREALKRKLAFYMGEKL
jgi:RNA polymerase sigma-70 factor (ECF subfamily)